MKLNISNNIEKLRLQNNWNQAQLAEKTGLSAAAISMYESGLREPSLESLVKLSLIFNVKMDDLVKIDIVKPRVFEFEGYLGESPMTSLEDMKLSYKSYDKNLIRNLFDYRVSKEFVSSEMVLLGYEKTSKWRIIVKEIIE